MSGAFFALLTRFSALQTRLKTGEHKVARHVQVTMRFQLNLWPSPNIARMTRLLRYLHQLNTAKQILWCYLIWYLTMSACYFDPAIHIWMTSLGVSVVIGIALILSVSNGNHSRPDRWTIARLFMMPFCVSSFSALVKDHGFILILSPHWQEDALAIGLCAMFAASVWLFKLHNAKQTFQ
jgi:hypothetical protein